MENYEVKNEKIQEILINLGNVINQILPKGWGFTLMIFNFEGEKTTENSMFYISSARSEDMLKSLDEFKEILKKD